MNDLSVISGLQPQERLGQGRGDCGAMSPKFHTALSQIFDGCVQANATPPITKQKFCSAKQRPYLSK